MSGNNWLILFLIVMSATYMSAQSPAETPPPQSATALKVYRVGGDVKPPKAISTPNPPDEKPEPTRKGKTKYRGTVVLLIVVGPEGTVLDVKVVRTLKVELDEKAIEAVKKWKFEPATKKGTPVAVQVPVEVDFSLY
jgi:periplasmic protein TonB